MERLTSFSREMWLHNCQFYPQCPRRRKLALGVLSTQGLITGQPVDSDVNYHKKQGDSIFA